MAAAVAGFTTAYSNGTSPVCSVPSGTASGDLLLAVTFSDSDGSFAAMTAPAGWTEVYSSSSVSATAGFSKIFTKTASGSEPSTYTFPASTNSANYVGMSRITGWNTTTAFAAVPSWSSPAAALTTSLVAPSVTPTGPGLLNCVFFQLGQTGPNTITAPSGMTGTSSRDTIPYLVDLQATLAGVASGSATGTKTATASGAGNTAAVGYLSVSFVIADSSATAVVNKIVTANASVSALRTDAGAVSNTVTAGSSITALRTDAGSVSKTVTASATITAGLGTYAGVSKTVTASATVTGSKTDPLMPNVTGTVTASASITGLSSDPQRGMVRASVTASAFIRAVTGFYFRTPSVREHPYSRNGLISRTYFNRGVTVLRFGSSYQQFSDVDPELITASDAAYLGGHIYFVDPVEAQRLRDAGYGIWVTGDLSDPIPDVDYSQYGTGFYGTGPYGD